MTSTTDTAQHPEVSEISDLTEGLLPDPRAAEVRRHVAGCALCAEVRDSLEEIRGLLGTLPDPEPMPEDIAARIDAALAAEARTDDPAADEPLHVSRETDVSRETEAVEPDGAPLVPPRADSVADRRIDASSPDRPAGRPQAATGPGRRSARRRRRAAILGTTCGAALLGMSVLLLQNLSSSPGALSEASDRAVSADESGAHRYSADTLEARVDELLTGSVGKEDFGGKKVSPQRDDPSASEAASPEVATPESPLSAPAVAVPPCVQKATGRTTPALALDEGTYRGTDTFLVVLPHANDPSRVNAYVVAASCVDTAPKSTGQLLLTKVYDRP
ncbi:hypothetical protein [Streptomyces sp. cmx-18-6]|uniref:hypothetical protein n=1 Tax=Streptomyces sp. cmx-18-6 TaxID=2790930 RepID=UPI00398070D2